MKKILSIFNFVISPISLMMIDAEAGNQKNNLNRSFDFEGKTFVPIALGLDSISTTESFFSQRFARTSDSNEYEPNLSKLTIKPGMPIVVDLVKWTDEKGKTSSLGATGTITYVDDDGRVFAFGHPFLNSKKVVYAFRTAEIIDTIFSDDPRYNYKLTGRTSDVRGTINRDSSYGVYGNLGSEELKRLRHFSLEFKSKGILSHKFEIKVAESIMTPILIQAAFGHIGDEYGAPLPQETSVTQIESRIETEGHRPIVWKRLYPSKSVRFGSQILYFSSFEYACEEFVANVYAFLLDNSYGLKMENISISVNFIPGTTQTYKMGAYKFPNKVVYGQDPVLDVVFVDENNTMPIAKRVIVRVNWNKVEKPVYLSQTNDKDKVPEKIVRGQLLLQSSGFYLNSLSSEEHQTILPKYFLDPDDFLNSLDKRLDITNQKIFARVGLRSRSGLFDEVTAVSENIVPTDITTNEQGWHIIKERLKERMITLKNSGFVMFFVDLPEAPSGYVFDENINESVYFEVIL